MKSILFLFSSLLIISNNILISQTKYIYPVAKKTTYADTYHGTVVEDPYSWMEDMQGTELKNWINEENKFTDNYLKQNSVQRKN